MSATAEDVQQPEELATHLRLGPEDLVPAELVERRWYAWVPIDTPIERVVDPRFLTRCHRQLLGTSTIERPVDIIVVMPRDRRWWLETIVVAVGSEEIQILKMRYGELPDARSAQVKRGPPGQNLDDYEYRPAGAHKGWEVVRKDTGQVVYQGARLDQCKVWLTGHLQRVRSK